MYILFYINVDEPENSEIYGIYSSLNSAVENLILISGYKEIDRKLLQFFTPSISFKSMKDLKAVINRDLILIDYDIYKIEKI